MTLALWRKRYDKPRQHIKKQRHHFADKGPYSQSCGFSSSHVWMWNLDHTEGWVLKNWCFWRLLRVPWTARRSNQSILKQINPEYSLEGLILKLKLQYFGQLMRRTNSLEKTLMLGKIEGRRRRGWQRMRWLDGITDIPSAKTRLGASQVCLIVVMVIWLNAFVKIENYVPKVHVIRAMVFIVVMCGYESWTIKKAEPQKTDTSKLWCQRRLLRVPW